jgi:hypothetical protein
METSRQRFPPHAILKMPTDSVDNFVGNVWELGPGARRYWPWIRLADF